MRFLIIRLSSIGDIVLTTPVIRCLYKQVPGATIHYLVKKNFASILESNPFVHKVHYWKDDIAETIKELSAEKFEAVIDLHHNLRTFKIKSALPAKSYSFHKLNVEKWLMTALKWNRLPDSHITDRYLDTISSFGAKNDGEGLDYFIPEKDIIIPGEISGMLNRNYVSVVIGAAHYTKRLPLHKMGELLKGIQYPVVLLGGQEDQSAGNDLALHSGLQVFNACGKFNLNQSASLVKQSSMVITHDTGLMHIAAAFRKPMISIWGNTIPEFGMYALYGNAGTNDYRAEVRGLKCRPCSKIGYRQCPQKHFRCMEEQDIQIIIDKVNATMNMA
jgi:ADP-heptose:LPS heptosyltransferase